MNERRKDLINQIIGRKPCGDEVLVFSDTRYTLRDSPNGRLFSHNDKWKNESQLRRDVGKCPIIVCVVHREFGT